MLGYAEPYPILLKDMKVERNEKNELAYFYIVETHPIHQVNSV